MMCVTFTALLSIATMCSFANGANAEELTPSEQQRIEAIIEHIGGLEDAVFVRNGKDYDAKTAVEFLRGKWKRKASEVKSAEDFIENIASKSSTTGKSYVIRFSNGKEVKAEEYIRSRIRATVGLILFEAIARAINSFGEQLGEAIGGALAAEFRDSLSLQQDWEYELLTAIDRVAETNDVIIFFVTLVKQDEKFVNPRTFQIAGEDPATYLQVTHIHRQVDRPLAIVTLYGVTENAPQLEDLYFEYDEKTGWYQLKPIVRRTVYPD